MKLDEAVAELNPFDEFWQAVSPVEFPPFGLGRHHQPERHGQSGFSAEAALGPSGAVPDGGEGALDRVGNRYEDSGANVRR